MRTAWLITAVMAVIMGSGPARAGTVEETGASRKEPWKAEDIIHQETPEDYRISPNGKWLAWVKSAGDKEKDERISNLILTGLTENREIPLTRGSDLVRQPRWSPDGKLIAFLSTRTRPQAKPEAAKTQVWLIRPDGGEPWALTELAREPQHLEWLDSETLLYSAEEDPSFLEQELKRKKDDSQVADDETHTPPVRLFKVSVKDGTITRLTQNTDWIDAWSVSHSGQFAVASHQRSLRYRFDQKIPPVTILHDLSAGTEKQIFTEGRIRPVGFRWAPDNSGFYAIVPYSNDPRFLTAFILKAYFFDVATGTASEVNLDWENGLGLEGAAMETAPGGFVVLLAAGSRFEPARYTAEKTAGGWTWRRQSLEGEHVRNLHGFTLSQDGRTIVYEYSTASRMEQLYRAQLDGAKIAGPAQITKLNAALVNGRMFAQSEVIRWKGSQDEEVEGILYYPANYTAGKKYPLITAIHGGPTGWDMDAWNDEWAYPVNLLTQRGAFVLRPNYHGSGNYGLKWAESICCGKYYDLETPDINLGVDAMIAQGKADPERIATLGWSNGSILSISLITTYPERYKVASTGAGDVEWISDWGNVVFGDTFDSYYFGKSPLEDPELYVRKSPFFKMDRVKAPVLIFHGTADVNVPPAQSWSFFRALQHIGKVPVKFVIFPGEPHGPRKLTHQVRKVEEEIAWFDKYFFKTAKEENDALKQGSPLEHALRARTASRVEGRYGIAFIAKAKSPRKVLIPEAVRRGPIYIGRFEVTRAQFAEFDKGFKFAPGTENLPATGITLEQAKAYATWLANLTGEDWRIGQESDVAGLQQDREGENTLDYWAGYSPNPENAARLREDAKKLPGTAPLLKEAGSFRSQNKEDEEPLYDLGGNAAEWVLTSEGKGKLSGGSADCPADVKSDCTPAPEYAGFRIVRGPAKAVSAE